MTESIEKIRPSIPDDKFSSIVSSTNDDIDADLVRLRGDTSCYVVNNEFTAESGTIF